MSLATIVNGRPSHMLMALSANRSTLFCPVCSLVGARLTLRNVRTVVPEDPIVGEDDPDVRKPFDGSKVRGRLPGEHRALAIRIACSCGAEFDVALIPNGRSIRFAFLLGGSGPK